MWPQESNRPGRLGPDIKGVMLYTNLHGLMPQTELQRGLKAELVSLTTSLGQLQMLLLAQSVPSFAVPRLAPPNATTTLAFVISALSVPGASFLILELDRPLGGWIEISGQPMRNALKYHQQTTPP